MGIFLRDVLSELYTFVLFLPYVIPQNRLVDFDWNLYNKTDFEFRDSNPRLAARWSDAFLTTQYYVIMIFFCTFG